MFQKAFLKLYFVAGTQDCTTQHGHTPEQKLLGTLETALKSGITCYQLREKGAGALQDETRIRALAAECQRLCREHNVPFVLNNHVLEAIRMGADGVHIGQKDMAAAEAVAHCRGRLFLGISNNNPDHVRHSLSVAGIDYFACGPVFPTQSKADVAPAVGMDFVRQVRQSIGDKPLVAIGGITSASANQARAMGADGVAVISAIAKADDVAAAVRALL